MSSSNFDPIWKPGCISQISFTTGQTAQIREKLNSVHWITTAGLQYWFYEFQRKNSYLSPSTTRIFARYSCPHMNDFRKSNFRKVLFFIFQRIKYYSLIQHEQQFFEGGNMKTILIRRCSARVSSPLLIW